MQQMSISVTFVPHRLRCMDIGRGVPSVTQNVFLFLLRNCWISVSQLNSPFMNMKQTSLEVFPLEKYSIYRPLQHGNTYAASSHNGFSWVSVLYVWILLSQRCWDTKNFFSYIFKYILCLLICIHMLSWHVSINKGFILRIAGLLHSV